MSIELLKQIANTVSTTDHNTMFRTKQALLVGCLYNMQISYEYFKLQDGKFATDDEGRRDIIVGFFNNGSTPAKVVLKNRDIVISEQQIQPKSFVYAIDDMFIIPFVYLPNAELTLETEGDILSLECYVMNRLYRNSCYRPMFGYNKENGNYYSFASEMLEVYRQKPFNQFQMPNMRFVPNEMKDCLNPHFIELLKNGKSVSSLMGPEFTNNKGVLPHTVMAFLDDCDETIVFEEGFEYKPKKCTIIVYDNRTRFLPDVGGYVKDEIML
jgi:hypothetical protein